MLQGLEESDSKSMVTYFLFLQLDSFFLTKIKKIKGVYNKMVVAEGK